MDELNPLSNQTLKCIMQYIDANKRIHIAAHFPEVHNVHHLVPLRIETLKLEESCFTINRMKYSFKTIITNKPEEVTPLNQWTKYIKSCINYDVDQYGEKDENEILMPGDISIEETREENLAQIRQQLEKRGQEVRKNTEPPYAFIQYTVTCLSTYKRKSFRFPLGTKIQYALRKLAHNMFYGEQPINVKRLEIPISSGILRLPENLKLNVQELILLGNSNAVIKAVEQIINESSFPLKKISIKVKNQNDPVFQNVILRSSESVEIQISRKSDGNWWSNALSNLPNRCIHLSYMQISIGDFTNLVENWKTNPRRLGSMFSMQCSLATGYLRRIVKAKDQLGAVEKLIPKYGKLLPGLSIPITQSTELNFYRWKSPNYHEEIAKLNGKPSMVVMEVMPVRSARPLL